MIFAEGGGGAIYYNWQLTPGGGWSGWSFFSGGPVAGPPAVAENADGTLQVFAVINNVVYTDHQVTPGDSSDWTGWVGLAGASIATTPSTITDYSGNLYIFAQGTDSAAWYNVRSAATGVWSGWSSLGGGIFGSPSAALNLDGRIEIFVLGGGNTPFHNWQNSDLATWSGWASLGGQVVTTPTPVVNSDGRIEIFAVGTDAAGWHAWQATAGGTWSGWDTLGGDLSSPIGAFRNIDGRLEVFALAGANGGSMYLNYQVCPYCAWSGWYPIGSASTPGTSQGANYADIGFKGGPLSETESDAVSNFWGGSNPTNAVTPTQVGAFLTWPCATVAVSFSGFSSNYEKRLQKAIDNWNFALASIGSGVYFTRGAGDGIHSMTVRYTKIVADPTDTGPPITAFSQGYTHLRVATPDPNGNLGHVDIDIANTITSGGTLTNVLAHEIGHTFQLADCPKCGTPQNPGQPFSTVMSSNNDPTKTLANAQYVAACASNPSPSNSECASVVVNFAQGTKAPTSADLNAVRQADPGLLSCGNQTNNQNIACNDGSTPSVTQGFASNGTVGAPVTTCDGTACDSCNPQCSSFSSANCTGGGGGGGGNPPDPCSQPSPLLCDPYFAECSPEYGWYCSNMCMGSEPAPCCDDCYIACENGEWTCIGSPILIDAFGNGFHLTDVKNGVRFQVLPKQGLHQMSWPDAAARDGWLALDRNGDGKITDFTELFGNATQQPPGPDKNGYRALAVFDDPANGGNGNGVIDPGDSVYEHLLVWIDDNHNGISEPQELHSLRDAGIFRIDLTYHLSTYVDENGNQFRYRARIWDHSGVPHDACYDVFVRIAMQE